MDGCIYRTKDGECDLYADGGKYHAFCVGDAPCDGRKQSNADKIRQMSDEGLADFIARQRFSVVNPIADKLGIDVTAAFIVGRKNALDWLKQEAEE